MNMSRLMCIALQLLGLLMVPTSAFAVCGMMPNYREGVVVDMNFGRVTVPSGTAIGDVFFTQEFPITGSYYAIVACKPGDTTQWRVVQGTATSIPNVYTTNIAGVGMRTSWIPARSSTPFYAGDSTSWTLGMPNVSGSIEQNSAVVSVTGSVVVELIKLSDPVGSGALVGGTYTNNIAQPVYPFNSGVFLSTRIAGGGGEIVPQTGTCSIGDLNVDLAPVPFGRFNGLGSTTGETPFTVSFNCSEANGAVTLTMDADRFMPDGSLGLIKPQAGDNYASCVALQVLDANTGVPALLGATSVVGSVVNNATSFNLPYRVRYYQSGGGSNCVSPGLVKGTATVTVKYQ
jgi:type 1 fimbria pilin